MQQVLHLAKQAGLRQLVAVTGDNSNTASIAFHRAQGFAHPGTLTDAGYKNGRWLDVVLMQRPNVNIYGVSPEKKPLTLWYNHGMRRGMKTTPFDPAAPSQQPQDVPASPRSWARNIAPSLEGLCDIARLDILEREAKTALNKQPEESFRAALQTAPVANENYLAWRRLRNEDRLADSQVALRKAEASVRSRESDDARSMGSTTLELKRGEVAKLSAETALLRQQRVNAAKGKRI